MSEKIDNLVLEILKKMQGDMSDLKADNREIKTRLGIIESKIAHLDMNLAELSMRIDRRDDAFERMSRRLELNDSPLSH